LLHGHGYKKHEQSKLAGRKSIGMLEYHELAVDICNLALKHLTKIQLVCVFREVIHPTLTTRIGISTYWSLFSRLPPAPGDPGHIHLAVLHCASNHPKWQQPWKEEKGKAFGFNGT